ncbi:GLUG motif-containing protein [Niveispirillum sp. KHB5.9]|uniref:GLUG motif-containing protein n=1 Tax=Niveispirillum sp. KHB5.9 TaxID=3400269 RepID=UPI003A8583B1
MSWSAPIQSTYIGGLVGYMLDGLIGSNSGTVSAVYATGSVNPAGATTGGLVGTNNGTVTAGFWDQIASGLTVGTGSGTGSFTGGSITLAVAALSTATYAGFDFTTDWYNIEGRTRPFLRSEYATTIVNGHQLQLMHMDPTAAYRLGGNIDMSELVRAGGLWGSALFTPIGFNTAGFNSAPTSFSGSLDGQGFTINTLRVSISAYHNLALISNIGTTGSVANLTLAGGTVTAAGLGVSGFGMVAGRSQGTLSNVHAMGTVTAGASVAYVGGLVGLQTGGSILSSHSEVVTRAGNFTTALGGLAGAVSAQAVISSSYATGTVSVGTTGQNIGVLVGHLDQSTITNSYATGALSVSVSVQRAGGLVGLATTASILNSYATGTVSVASAVQFIGGLVGLATTGSRIADSYATGGITLGGFTAQRVGGLHASTITNGYATGNITGTTSASIPSHVGGLVGEALMTTVSPFSSLIIDSRATGSVSLGATANYVGGLVGSLGGSTIANSHATGGVIVSTNSGTVSAASGIGGLVGAVTGVSATASRVYSSYASGSVSAATGAGPVGGLIGYVNNSTIVDTYATGNVTQAGNPSANAGIGGLVGMVGTGSSSFVSRSWVSGSVVAAGTGVRAGGLVGAMGGGAVTAGYWDVITSGRTVGVGVGVGTAGTGTFSAVGVSGTGALASASYADLDFTTAWFMVEGFTRPFLRMENAATIVNAHQLQAIAVNPAGTYVLGANITMTELGLARGLWGSGASFAPIGANGTANDAPTAFTGSLDGRGYSVSGLTINASAGANIGLFSTIGSTGSVANLTLTSALVTGSGTDLGLLAGRNSGTVSAVKAGGVLVAASGALRAGGLVGTNSGLVTASFANGTVSATSGQSIGGMAGHNTGTILGAQSTAFLLTGSGVQAVGGLAGHNAGLIAASNDASAITVGSGAQSVGGLAGYNTGTVTASNAASAITVGSGAQSVGGLVGHDTGLISRSDARALIRAGSGAQHVGGLAGSVSAGGTVSGSYAAATVTVGGSATNMGGLVGANAGLLMNAYALGPVSAMSTGTAMGGLAGSNTGTITGVYATGSVGGGTGTTLLGGLVGDNGGTVTGYWDIITTGQNAGTGGGTGSATITGISGTDAYAGTSYAGFDLANIWYMVEGYTRPVLRAEYSTTITSAHQLLLIDLDLTASYVLDRDINMAEPSQAAGIWATATGFMPIGFNTSNDNATPGSFTGTLDGQGHAINNLTITSSSASNLGLFSSIGAGGVVRSVGVYNGTMTGGTGSTIGLLAGSNAGTIHSAYSTGIITAGSGAQYVGGLVGSNSGTISVAYSTALVTVGASAGNVGGLAGSNSGLVTLAYASGAVSAGGGSGGIGGLIGNNAGTVAGAYWDGGTGGQVSAVGTGSGSLSATNVSGTAAYATATYTGFDLTGTWYMMDGYMRPMLRMEQDTVVNNMHQLQLITLDLTADYRLAADITMVELARAGGLWASTGWVPIGMTAAANAGAGIFSGQFAGRGHTISGMTMNHAVSVAHAAMFSKLGNGALRDFSLLDARVTSAAGKPVALVVGEVVGTAAISSVLASGTILASGSAATIGALAAYMNSETATIQNSGALIDIRHSGNGAVIGGLVGFGAGLITGSYAMGSISISGSGSQVGGLAGVNFAQNTLVDNYAQVNITVGGAATAVGGLIGNNSVSTANGVLRNYAAGVLSVGTVTSVGGLIGVNTNTGDALVSNYWDTTLSGRTLGIGNGTITTGFTGLATSAWVSNGPVANSVFPSSVWMAGSPYPVLKTVPYILVTGSGGHVYGGTAGSVTTTGAFDQLGNSVTSGLSTGGVSWTLGTTPTVVGSATATGTGAVYSGTALYQLAYGGTYSVTAAPLTITAGNVTKTYGTSAGLTGFSAAGLVNGDSVGTVILASSGAAANAKTGFTASGLVNGDSVGQVDLSSPGAPAAAIAGTYVINAASATGTGLGNYTIRYQEGQLTVTPAATLSTGTVQRIVVNAVVPTVVPVAAGPAPATTQTTAAGSGGPAVQTGGTGSSSAESGSPLSSLQTFPVDVAGAEGGVYSQIQMTSDPIKGTQQDEQQ